MLTYNKTIQYLYFWGVPKINKKRFFICLMLAFLFISTDVFSPDLANTLSMNSSYTTVYAKGGGSSHSSGGFKSSGSFSAPKSSSGTSKSSTGDFKSGSFSNTPKSSSGTTQSGSSSTTTKSSTGDFKSGGFSNTPKSSTADTKSQSNTNTSSSRSYDSGTKRSFLPIPIPIPWGSSHSYYGPSYGHGSSSFAGSFILWLFKLIFIIIIIIIIIKLIKKYRRK